MMRQFLGYLRKSFRVILGPKSHFARPAVFVLGLGLGSVSIVFSLFDQTLLQVVPGVPGQDRLAAVSFHQGDSQYPASLPLYRHLERSIGSFSAFAGSTVSSANLSGANAAAATRVVREEVTGGFFSVLGIKMALGRDPTAEGAGFGPDAAVISHRLWKRIFAGALGAPGKKLLLDTREITIAGIAPPGFKGTSMASDVDVWTLLRLSDSESEDPRYGLFFTLIGRFAPGSSLEKARLELQALASALDPPAWGLGSAESETRCLVNPDIGRDPALTSLLERTIRLLFGAAALILTVAALNAAGLLLSQNLARRREWSVLQALGAGRRQILAQVLGESLAIGIMGGTCGALMALIGGQWASQVQLAEGYPGVFLYDWNGRVFLFTFLTSMLAGLSAGLIPAWISVRSDLMGGLRGHSGSSNSFSKLKGALVTGQLAASFILIAGSLLFLKSLSNLYEIDLGFQPRGVVNASIEPGLLQYSQQDALQLYRRLKSRLASRPGIESIGLAEIPPFEGTIRPVRLLPEEGAVEPVTAWRNRVSSGYLKAVGLRHLRGRDFSELEGLERPQGASSVAILSKAVAEKLWPGSTALGKRFNLQGRQDLVEVIGVADDHRTLTMHSPAPVLYEPLGQGFIPRRVSLLLKTGLSSAEAGHLVRAEMDALDAGVAVFNVEALSARLDQMLSKQRLFSWAVPMLAFVALLLAALGLWGLLAGNIRLRSGEIGIRIALGAGKWDIQKLELGRVALLTFTGMGFGLAGLAALSKLVASHLYGTSALDPSTILAALLFLCLCTALAGGIPLRRAALVDPSAALRSE